MIVRCIRDSRLVEKLLKYVCCNDMKGRSIVDFWINIIKNVALNPMCRSQTYNRAGLISGKRKGTRAIFRLEIGNYKTLYFHCVSHEPNLYLSKASTVPKNFKYGEHSGSSWDLLQILSKI